MRVTDKVTIETAKAIIRQASKIHNAAVRKTRLPINKGVTVAWSDIDTLGKLLKGVK